MSGPRPPFFSIPDELPGRMLDAGLGAAAVGLNLIAWAESSRYQLDGLLPVRRARSLRQWTAAREAELIAAGFWDVERDCIHLASYLSVNRSRSEIENLRAARAAAGLSGGQARSGSAPRDTGGRFAQTPGENLGKIGPDSPRERTGAPRETSRQLPGPTATATPTSPGSLPSSASLVRDGQSGWGPEWSEFLEAWFASGLRLPPSAGQRAVLWPVVDARPRDASRWCGEVPPGARSHDVVRHVLDRWRSFGRLA